MDTDYNEGRGDQRVELVVTIRADVPVWVIPSLMSTVLSACPEDGVLTIEIDGSNQENGSKQ